MPNNLVIDYYRYRGSSDSSTKWILSPIQHRKMNVLMLLFEIIIDYFTLYIYTVQYKRNRHQWRFPVAANPAAKAAAAAKNLPLSEAKRVSLFILSLSSRTISIRRLCGHRHWQQKSIATAPAATDGPLLLSSSSSSCHSKRNDIGQLSFSRSCPHQNHINNNIK